MKYYVIINGESSLDIEGLAIESLPAISKPLMRSKREEIDGRDGDIITQLGFSAYDKTLKIGLWGNYDIDEIISYFNQDGIISFSNEPDKYYNFTILNRIDFINQLEAFRKATITIHCQPFKYKEEETEELDIITKEVSGTDISVNDSYSGTMDIDLNGNTYQKTTSIAQGDEYDSPSPDHPQDINVVSGNNSVVVCGKNLFDKDNANYVNGWITGTTMRLNTTNGNRMFYIPCKPNTTYTISRSIITSSFRVATYDSTPFPTVTSSNVDYTVPTVIENNSGTSLTITTGANAKYLVVHYGKQEDTNLNETLATIQIEYGNQATTYSSYTGATYPINLPVQGYNTPNLYDPTTAPVIDGCMAVKSAMKLHGVSLTKIKTTYMACNQNTKYLITKTLGGTNYFDVGTTTNTPAINGSLNQCEDAITETSYEITTGANDNYIVVSYWQDSETGDTKGSITIKEYSTKKEELSKIGTYQDYIYKDNDKWYLHKETGKYTFTGNESFSSVSEGYYMSFSGALTTSPRTIICNNYNNYLTYSPFVVSNYGISFLYSATQLYVRDKDISSASDLKTKLANSGTYFYYKLETPTNTEITDTSLKEQLEAIKEAQSYLGTTNINQVNNDMPFILDVSYLSGTNSITITNHGNYYSKPKLTITGTGNIGIYLNDSQIFQVALGTNETIIIDTDKMEAYYESTLKNRQVIGDYNSFKLLSGENTIKISGTFSKLQVDNYSRWI